MEQMPLSGWRSYAAHIATHRLPSSGVIYMLVWLCKSRDTALRDKLL